MMETAFTWAARSTCDRLHVGAVFHRDGRILVQGYNGAPTGFDHCDHSCDCRFPDGKIHATFCNSQKPCTRAVHAEQNGISFAARWGVGLEGADLAVTHQPCLSCAMSIINAGIQTVTYSEPYRLIEGIELIRRAGIKVTRLELTDSALDDRIVE
jgi:dCMP deaminase